MSDPKPVYIDYVERKIALTPSVPATKRYMMFTVIAPTERWIFINYSLLRWTDRKIMFGTPFVYNEKIIFVPPRILTVATSRFCSSPPAAPCTYERYCTFIPGGQLLAWTTKVVLPFKFITERKGYVAQDPVSIRQIRFVLEVPEEKLMWLQCVGDSRISSPLAHLTLRRVSERPVYFEILDKVTQRRVSLLLEVPNERLITLQVQRLARLYTPPAQMGLYSVYNERWCVAGGEVSCSDRFFMFFLHSLTERYMQLTFTAWEERVCEFRVTQANNVFSFHVVMARPVPTERMITYVPIVYLTERQMWGETRDRYNTKIPSISSNTTIISSNTDINSQLSIKNQRDFEIANVNKHSKDIDDNRITINIASPDSTISVSMVDNMGASITQDPSKVSLTKNLITASMRLYIFPSPSVSNKIMLTSSYKKYPDIPFIQSPPVYFETFNDTISWRWVYVQNTNSSSNTPCYVTITNWRWMYLHQLDASLERTATYRSCSGLTDRQVTYERYSDATSREICFPPSHYILERKLLIGGLCALSDMYVAYTPCSEILQIDMNVCYEVCSASSNREVTLDVCSGLSDRMGFFDNFTMVTQERSVCYERYSELSESNMTLRAYETLSDEITCFFEAPFSEEISEMNVMYNT